MLPFQTAVTREPAGGTIGVFATDSHKPDTGLIVAIPPSSSLKPPVRSPPKVNVIGTVQGPGFVPQVVFIPLTLQLYFVTPGSIGKVNVLAEETLGQ